MSPIQPTSTNPASIPATGDEVPLRVGASAADAPPAQGVRFPAQRLGWPLVRALRRDPQDTWHETRRAGDAVQARIPRRDFHFLFHPAMVRAALAGPDEAIPKEDRQLRVFQAAISRSPSCPRTRPTSIQWSTCGPG